MKGRQAFSERALQDWGRSLVVDPAVHKQMSEKKECVNVGPNRLGIEISEEAEKPSVGITADETNAHVRPGDFGDFRGGVAERQHLSNHPVNTDAFAFSQSQCRKRFGQAPVSSNRRMGNDVRRSDAANESSRGGDRQGVTDVLDGSWLG
jgi:hypothetical protein